MLAVGKRPQPKGKLQRAAIKHQKATGGRGTTQAAASRPASASVPASGQLPQQQAVSNLAVKAAEIGGLRLCLMMIILEHERRTKVPHKPFWFQDMIFCCISEFNPPPQHHVNT